MRASDLPLLVARSFVNAEVRFQMAQLAKLLVADLALVRFDTLRAYSCQRARNSEQGG